MTDIGFCSKIKQNTIIIVLHAILVSFVSQIIMVTSPIIILHSTNSLILSGLTISLIFSSDVCINYHAGKLCDKIGRKKTLIIGTLMTILAVWVLSISRLLNEQLLFWLGLFFFGLSGGFLVLNRAALTDMYPQKRGHSLGYLNISAIIGYLLATAFMVSLSALETLTTKNYYDILIFSCLPVLGLAGYVMTLMKIDTKKIGQALDSNELLVSKNSNSLDEEKWISEKYSKNELILALLISALSMGGLSTAMSLTPIILSGQNIQTGAISFSVFLILLGTNILSIISGRVSDKIGRQKVILFAGIIMGGSFILFSLTENYIILSFIALLIGFGAGSLAISSTAWICDITKVNHRGKVFGTNSLTLNIITFIFPILALALFDSFGTFSISVMGLTFMLFVFLLMYKSINKKS